MKKKNIIILSISILFFIGALALFIYAKFLFPQKSDTITNNISKKVDNEFSKNSAEPYFFDMDGEKHNLSDFYNKPVVLFLWKSDDSKSYTIINLITKYYEEYKDKINFLTVNVNEPDIDLDLKTNVEKANFSIPIYFDSDLTLYNEFFYEKLPDILFINESGEIEKETLETIDEDAFLANLDLMIKNY